MPASKTGTAILCARELIWSTRPFAKIRLISSFLLPFARFPLVCEFVTHIAHSSSFQSISLLSIFRNQNSFSCRLNTHMCRDLDLQRTSSRLLNSGSSHLLIFEFKILRPFSTSLTNTSIPFPENCSYQQDD